MTSESIKSANTAFNFSFVEQDEKDISVINIKSKDLIQHLITMPKFDNYYLMPKIDFSYVARIK